jgi:dolichol-phosphate mannosyltransferase
MSIPDISIVVPVYKEEDNIRPFLARTEEVLQNMGLEYEIIFCLDPSPDATETVIRTQAAGNSRIKMIKFSRRFGQPVATMAGISHCAGNSCLVIDVDMQDPPELIEDLYAKLQEGYDVVYAKRRQRKGESWIKLLVSHVGYRFINAISDVEIPQDTGDFRIMSRRVVDHLKQLGEQNCFLRGLVAFVGFKQTFLEYDRVERFKGKGNYNRYLGSLKIGVNGIVSFSNILLSMTSLVGILTVLISLAIICFIVITKLFFNYPYPLGTPTIIVLILFIGGIQILSIGFLGEYIGRIYDEVKRRPRYIIGDTLNMGKVN